MEGGNIPKINTTQFSWGFFLVNLFQSLIIQKSVQTKEKTWCFQTVYSLFIYFLQMDASSKKVKVT